MKSAEPGAEEQGNGGSSATHVIAVTCDLYHPAYLSPSGNCAFSLGKSSGQSFISMYTTASL